MNRYILMLLLSGTLPCIGCSYWIAGSGTDVSKLTTRDAIHHEFGEPVAIGLTWDKDLMEEYHTRRKLAEPVRAAGLGMGFAFTAGLFEFLAFPYEVYRLGRTAIVGQKLLVIYDSSGRVVDIRLDDEPEYFDLPGEGAEDLEGMGIELPEVNETDDVTLVNEEN